MALIDCPECGKQVSDHAPACPNCGMPIAAAPQTPQPDVSIPRGPIPKHLERELYGTAAAKERGQPGAVRKGFGAGFGGCLGIIVAVILIFIVLIAIASQSDGAELGTHGVLYLLT